MEYNINGSQVVWFEKVTNFFLKDSEGKEFTIQKKEDMDSEGNISTIYNAPYMSMDEAKGAIEFLQNFIEE